MAIITVGTTPTVGDSATGMQNATLINITTPANASGVIDTIQLMFANTSNGQGIKFATFHSDGSGYYTCRSVTSLMNIGSATADTIKTVTGLNLTITAGDYIGVYGGSTFTGALYTKKGSIISVSRRGDNTANGSQLYDYIGTYFRDIRIYGSGSTLTSPTVTTQAVSDITKDSATGNGNITDTGGVNATRRGFCYKVGTTGDPTVSDSVVYDDGSFGTGAYTKAITGLSPNTSYRVRAYAVNSAGTSYGSTVGFTTLKADESNFFQLF